MLNLDANALKCWHSYKRKNATWGRTFGSPVPIMCFVWAIQCYTRKLRFISQWLNYNVALWYRYGLWLGFQNQRLRCTMQNMFTLHRLSLEYLLPICEQGRNPSPTMCLSHRRHHSYWSFEVGISFDVSLYCRLGLDPKMLAKILNMSSGRCWSSEVYNPCPGVLDGVPSSNQYKGGFGTALMTKVILLQGKLWNSSLMTNLAIKTMIQGWVVETPIGSECYIGIKDSGSWRSRSTPTTISSPLYRALPARIFKLI